MISSVLDKNISSPTYGLVLLTIDVSTVQVFEFKMLARVVAPFTNEITTRTSGFIHTTINVTYDCFADFPTIVNTDPAINASYWALDSSG